MARSSISDRWRIGLVAALLSVNLLAGAQAPTPPPVAWVVFWTADDCPWCNTWKNGDRRPEFEAEAARLGVGVATRRKPSMRSPDAQFDWQGPPGPALEGVPPPRVVPTFDYLCRGQARKRLMSLADWDSFWRSELRRLARECR